MKCEVKRLSPYRLLSIYAYEALGTGHNMYAQIELDVTDIRIGLRSQRKEGRKVSFFGYLLSAIAKTVDENRELNHIRCGKKIYCFDEVDIHTAIEMQLDGVPVPRIYLVQNAAQKSPEEITQGIENAKDNWRSGSVGEYEKWGKRWLKLSSFLPKSLIRFFIRQVAKNPIKMKERFGTVYVTSVSGFSDASGFIIPFFEGQNRPLAFAIGNVVKKPGIVNSEIKIREYLSMTISFNHDLVDGAPAARFINQLKQRIETYKPSVNTKKENFNA